MIEVQKIIYKKFGNCIQITTKTFCVIVTIDFGPRIICFKPINGNNLLFEDIHDNFKMNDKKHQKLFGHETWHCYGGHRLWASPESILTYAPDNQPVSFKQIEDEFIFIGHKLPILNLQMTLILKVQNNNLIVKQKILNLGPKIIDAAVWSLTQFAANGTAIFKFNNHNTGFLPNRKLIIWPYTNLNDPRLFLGDEYASLKMDPKNNRPLKLGMDSRIGRVSYILKNYQLIINYPNLQNANYPDFGCNLETYTNNYFLELETLSPLCKLLQGKSMTHNEIWKIKTHTNIQNLRTDDNIKKIF